MNMQEPEYKQYIRNVLKNNIHTAKYYYSILAKDNVYGNDEFNQLLATNNRMEERLANFLLDLLNNNALSEAAKTVEKWKKSVVLQDHNADALLRLLIEDYKIMIKVTSNFLGTYYINLHEIRQVVSYFEDLQENLEGIIQRMGRVKLIKEPYHV